MKAAVVYDTLFGNTAKVAEALSRGLRAGGVTVDCLNVKDVNPQSLGEYALIAVGGPTQALSASKAIKEFLAKLDGVTLAGRFAFAFDTKVDYFFAGSAGGYIEKKLKGAGMKVLAPHASAFVKGPGKNGASVAGEAVLVPDAEKEFESIGAELAKRMPMARSVSA